MIRLICKETDSGAACNVGGPAIVRSKTFDLYSALDIQAHVEKGAEVFTDALASYEGLDPDYVHQVIDHAECYAKGKVHTNGLENFWSLLKRGIKGTYVSVEPFHLFRYLDEQGFRFNNRKTDDAARFNKALTSIGGKRLTYKALIGEDGDADSASANAEGNGNIECPKTASP